MWHAIRSLPLRVKTELKGWPLVVVAPGSLVAPGSDEFLRENNLHHRMVKPNKLAYLIAQSLSISRT